MKRSKKEVLDADFAAARAGVLDVAAFLDRVDRGETRLSVIPEISRVHPALRLREAAQDIRHMYGMFLQGGAQGSKAEHTEAGQNPEPLSITSAGRQ